MEILTLILLILSILITFFTILTKKSDFLLVIFDIILLSGVFLCKAHDKTLTPDESFILLFIASLLMLLLIPIFFKVGKK